MKRKSLQKRKKDIYLSTHPSIYPFHERLKRSNEVRIGSGYKSCVDSELQLEHHRAFFYTPEVKILCILLTSTVAHVVHSVLLLFLELFSVRESRGIPEPPDVLLSSISIKQCSMLVMYCIAVIKCETIKLKDSERIILKRCDKVFRKVFLSHSMTFMSNQIQMVIDGSWEKF